jgi:hypothetical protein
VTRINQHINGNNNQTAGGDIYDIENQITISIPSNSLKKAIEAIVIEHKNDLEYIDFIEDLIVYTQNRESEPIGLEQKLIDGNRNDLISDALFLKERFAKKIAKNQLSISIQKIYVEILGVINTIFRNKIKPLINEKSDDSLIDHAIHTEIIEYIYSQISDNSFIQLNMDDIHGMLYYLTGKCHIRWT